MICFMPREWKEGNQYVSFERCTIGNIIDHAVRKTSFQLTDNIRSSADAYILAVDFVNADWNKVTIWLVVMGPQNREHRLKLKVEYNNRDEGLNATFADGYISYDAELPLRRGIVEFAARL